MTYNNHLPGAGHSCATLNKYIKLYGLFYVIKLFRKEQCYNKALESLIVLSVQMRKGFHLTGNE